MQFDPALFQDNERTEPQADSRSYLDVGPLRCENGAFLPAVTAAYETWGELNADKSNAILICHAVSGDSHAIGWWERMVGPGKPFDTDRYFIICSNTLGGCQGTTGPTSLAPDGKPYGRRFPLITVGDMVDVLGRLIDHLGIPQLLAVAGGSMGGMQALEWTVRQPGRARMAFLTATCAAHSAMQIGMNEAARQAVMRDPKWKGGDYDPTDPPRDGLAVGRMIGHMSYLSQEGFEAKFGRRLQDKDTYSYTLKPEFAVESYLNYQGDKFTKRFDANSFLILTRAIDYYACASLVGSSASYVIVSYESDWLYPTQQSIELEQLAKRAGCPVTRVEYPIRFGHDSFLLDGDLQGALLRESLTMHERATQD